MSRNAWIGVVAVALAALIAMPAVWSETRPADRAGDVGAVEESLRNERPDMDTAPRPAPASASSDALSVDASETAPGGGRDHSENNGTPQQVDGAGMPLSGDAGRAFLLPESPRPVGLVIDALSVRAPIEPQGVDRSGQMAVPSNVTDVGWYRYGPSPGEDGSAVLAAHVDLAGRGKGVFFDLNRLEPGDLVAVRYDDDSVREFTVVARAEYDKQDLPLDVIFSREGSPVLTLITCGGAFNSSIGRYDSNIVVYAVPASDRTAGTAAT